MEEEKSKRYCFVVSPIGAEGSDTRIHADWFFYGIVLPVFNNHFAHFVVERSDTITTPGMIDAQIIDRLLDHDLVIVDMSLLNANVFYETGIRHMAGKPIIHMCDINTIIPFDVSLYRAVKYSRSRPQDLDKAKLELKNAVETALSPDHIVDNPITRVRGKENPQIIPLPTQQELIARIETLEQSLLAKRSLMPKTFSFSEIGSEMLVPLEVLHGPEISGDDVLTLAQPIISKYGRLERVVSDSDRNSLVLYIRFKRKVDSSHLMQELMPISGVRQVGDFVP